MLRNLLRSPPAHVRSLCPAMLALIAVLLVAGCADDDTATPATGPPTTAAHADDDLAWGPCTDAATGEPRDERYECATLEVPLDHDDPEGDQIDLALLRLPAAVPEERIGVLLFNPGGPGGPGVAALATLVDSGRYSGPVLDHFDFIGFDPRGIGESTPISCHDNLETLMTISNPPTDDAERQTLIDETRAFAESCGERHGDLIATMGSRNVAHDMDLIREALGEEQINYLGLSYGTRLGATYAALYPDRIRAMVLDGSVEPDATGFTFRAGQAPGFERSLEAWFEWCERSEDCPLAEDPRGAYEELLASLRDDPLEGDEGQWTLTSTLALTTISGSLYFEVDFQPLAEAMAAALEGNAVPLLDMVDAAVGRTPDGDYGNAFETNAAVNCADFPERPSLEEVEAFAQEMLEEYPVIGGATSGWQPLTCTFWPVEPDPVPAFDGRGAPAILVVGTTGDPATPFEWAEEMAAALEGGVLLVREGDGHTAYGGISDCIDKIVDRYLVTLVLPEDGSRCVPE